MKTINQLIKISFALIFFTQSTFALSARDIKKAQQFKIKEQLATKSSKNAETISLDEIHKKIGFDGEPEIGQTGLNYFQKIRYLAQKEQMTEMKALEKKGVLASTAIRFVPESFTFFVAIGAVNFMTMYKNAGTNPLLMEQHILSLKDPIAHASFFAFMLANGGVTKFLSQNLDKLTPEARSSAMRRISYQSLAAGSFVSSITADVLSSVQQCAGKLLKNDMTNQKYAQQVDEQCNQALSQWKLKRKTEQYLSSIFALGVSQFATEVVHNGINISGNMLLNSLKNIGAGKIIKIVGIELLTTAIPGKIPVMTYRFITKTTQFTMFVGVDHMMNSTLVRGFNNFFKNHEFTPSIYNNLGTALNLQLAGLNNYNWNPEQLNSNDSKIEKEKNELLENLQKFSESTQAWRDHLNADVDAEIAGWQENVQRMYSQVDLSEEYYSEFLNQLLDFSKTTYRNHLPENDDMFLPMTAWNNKTGYPYRKLPLFGLKFVPWINNDGKQTNVEEDKAYSLFPAETEKAQSEYLSQLANSFTDKINIDSLQVTPEQKVFIKKLMEDLKSKNPMVQGNALEQLQNYPLVARNIENANFAKLRATIISNTGRVEPKLFAGEGFNESFELKNKALFQQAQLDGSELFTGNKNNLFSLGTQMMYQMICGPEKAAIQEYTLNWTRPDFRAPQIVNQKPTGFCNDRLYEEKFYSTSIENNGRTFSPMEYITTHLKPAVFADYRDKNSQIEFSRWWTNNALTPLLPKIDQWDRNYQELIQKLDTNLFGRRIIDFLTQNPNSILKGNITDSLRTENKLYLNLVHLLKSGKKINMQGLGDNETFLKEISKTKSEILPIISDSQIITIQNNFEKLVQELSKPTFQIPSNYQIYPEEELLKLTESNKELSFLNNNINYKKYLSLKQAYLDSISELEVSVGLSQKKQSLYDDSFVYEPLQVQNPNYKQKVYQIATQNLRNLEGQISRFILLKSLVKYGLKFSEVDGKVLMNAKAKSTCTRTVVGCR